MTSRWPTAWRSAAVGALAISTLWLLSTTHLFATALVLLLGAGVLCVELMQQISRGSATSVDAGSAQSHARSAQLEYLQSMLDTVSAALFVMRADGEIVMANRAAHRLAATHVNRLHQIGAIGLPASAQIESLAVGTRQVLRLGEGDDALVSVSHFSTAAAEPQRLISIQRITGELDAVEIKAWRDMMRVLMHEVMNSLTPIASLSESLALMLSQQQTLSDAPWNAAEVQSALAAINRRSRGLIEFAGSYRQLSDLPQPVSQRIEAEIFANTLRHLLRTTAIDAGIALTVEVSPPGHVFHADPLLLEQAVINLIRNAFDAVALSAEPAVQVRIEQSDARISIAVVDNGCGVDPSIREQLWVPFFTTKKGGAGIGLSLARHIALAQGGGLEFRVNETRGSTFTLWLAGDRH
jgi:two-component system nitrogen regulation sensor histidine kinase NtrY